jgi:hypothetical protein
VKRALDIDGRVILKVDDLEIFYEDINWDELGQDRAQ